MATNFLSQLGGASAGLGSAIKNLYTMPSQVAQAEAQARLRSAQEAQLRQAMQQADFDNMYARKAREAIVGQVGDVAGALDLKQAQNIKNMYGADIYRRAAIKQGLMPDVGQVLEAHKQIQQQQQPQFDSSYGEDASVIRPISAIGQNQVIEAPKPDNAGGSNDVADFLEAFAQLEGAAKGSPMYNNVNRQGVAASKYFPNRFSIDEGTHQAAINKDNAQADKYRSEGRKADKWVPRARSNGRKSQGGNGKGLTPEQKRRKAVIDAGLAAGLNRDQIKEKLKQEGLDKI